jgi:CRISPR/Cas system-associated protein Cas10 (large subunit of type III CRISPR-Cas system)
MPDGVKLAELREVFIKYAKKNPEKLNLAASSVAMLMITHMDPFHVHRNGATQ